MNRSMNLFNFIKLFAMHSHIQTVVLPPCLQTSKQTMVLYSILPFAVFKQPVISSH